MYFTQTTFGIALLLSLSTFLTPCTAAPAAPGVRWGEGPDWPFTPKPDWPKPHQICAQCILDVEKCTQNYLSGLFNPELNGLDYQKNCECQQVQENRFCRVICGRTCQQWDYEGPY